MILGVGTDIVHVQRFVRWQSFSQQQRLRVFTAQELEACTYGDQLQPEKLAARFAAKEAFYKALCASLVTLGLTAKGQSFLALCRSIEVVAGTWHVPQLQVDWNFLNKAFGCTLPDVVVHLSIAHERQSAVAFVVISRR